VILGHQIQSRERRGRARAGAITSQAVLAPWSGSQPCIVFAMSPSQVSSSCSFSCFHAANILNSQCMIFQSFDCEYRQFTQKTARYGALRGKGSSGV
jgi:hypothetical protein